MPSRSMRLPAIEKVLGQYRSTDGHITQAMIEDAWAEHAHAQRVLSRPWWARLACAVRGHRLGSFANPQNVCVDCGKVVR